MWPSNPRSGEYPEETKIEKDTCTPMFTASWFIIADEWMKKLWYIYTIDYYSAIKRNTFESVLMRGVNIEPIIQSEVRKRYINIIYWHTYMESMKMNLYAWQQCRNWASRVAQRIKGLPSIRETWVWSLSWEDPLEKVTSTHSGTLAWKIPWMEKPARLQSMGSQRVGQDWPTTFTFTFFQWRNGHGKQTYGHGGWRGGARGWDVWRE